jgi:uncharacterized protein YlxW (UPF0749 family)
MSGGSHARPPEPPGTGPVRRRLLDRLPTGIAERVRGLPRVGREQRARAPGLWRVGTPAVVLVCGGLFVVSAANSDGTDLRPGRYTDLASLVKDEAEQYDALQTRFRELDAEVSALTAATDDRQVARYHRRTEQLKDPAGLTPRVGPGVSITLSDAPEDLINSTTEDVNRLLVHQQDIQAVVNALWRGGATAVTIQGQRIISTTGIKCDGNAVQLQGVPYPQPYVIEAVGDPAALAEAVESDDYVRQYREDAADPSIAVGWDLQLDSQVTAPAYDGLLALDFAEPLTDPLADDAGQQAQAGGPS